ncbi:hypothetical protein F5Y16DRAFT_353091 [Xylariaceae sp. FL0255]|nr:hypothetical protein F5Y16DRAFT_353091 [Xylariaceae sp. FL0255]
MQSSRINHDSAYDMPGDDSLTMSGEFSGQDATVSPSFAKPMDVAKNNPTAESTGAAKNDAAPDVPKPGTRKRKLSFGSWLNSEEGRKACEEAKRMFDAYVEPTEEEMAESRRTQLQEHSEQRSALFFIEKTPPSARGGSACQFIGCEDRIKQGDYRIALYPGMNHWAGSAETYHVKCFEKVADFSKSEFLKRLYPLTRGTYHARNLNGASISSGNYMLDGGAERLVQHWTRSMNRLIAERDGIEREPEDPEFTDLFNKAGSSSFNPKKPEGMSDFEYHWFCHSLAPIESDRPEDDDEWNLFDKFAPSSLLHRSSIVLMTCIKPTV